MHSAAIRVGFPIPPEGDAVAEVRQLYLLTRQHLTHTEMSYVCPTIEAAFYEFHGLNCVLEAPAARNAAGERLGMPCLRVVGGSQADAARDICARMAEEISRRDPYGLTSLDEARAMFELPPLKQKRRFFASFF